jgi:hypothetical protein
VIRALTQSFAVLAKSLRQGIYHWRTNIYFHSSGGWKFKIQWQHGWILAKAFFFWQKAAHFLRYLTRGKRVLSEVSFISALILFRRALPSRPIHLPKFHLLIPSHWD